MIDVAILIAILDLLISQLETVSVNAVFVPHLQVILQKAWLTHYQGVTVRKWLDTFKFVLSILNNL